jgi:bifunctional aspartokinase / homoserine dehydrogenase 1
MKQANIDILAIAQGCSEYNVTVVLKREDSIKALQAVHSIFYNSQTTMAMGIIGPGLIRSTLLDQLRDQVQFLFPSLCVYACRASFSAFKYYKLFTVSYFY